MSRVWGSATPCARSPAASLRLVAHRPASSIAGRLPKNLGKAILKHKKAVAEGGAAMSALVSAGGAVIGVVGALSAVFSKDVVCLTNAPVLIDALGTGVS